MGKLLWYRRDPNKALVGMKGLTLEERGAYNTVLDLIYAHDGAVDDDERFIAGWLGVDVRVWRRLRGRLIDAEKLYVEGSTLRNKAADVEVDRGLSRVASAKDAGKISAEKRAIDKSNNNDLTPTAVPTTVPTKQKQKQEEESTTEAEGASVVAPQPVRANKRGTRLPADWIPDDEGQRFAVEQTGSIEAARAEFAKFHDYWTAQPGAKGVKLDWPATWRNWCRNAKGFNGNRGPPRGANSMSFREVGQHMVEEIMRRSNETPPSFGFEAPAEPSGFDFGAPAGGPLRD